jgi:DNA (cytosine-5)-methyltransferase 1
VNVGSLFSGIGGIDLGLERAGMRVVWQVECDPYARAVLRKHWPDAVIYDDVRAVGAANLAPVDLICGGFPCQDISNAGKRVGIDGERSGLWSEYARIVRELRPRYVLVENVAALLARGLERVVGDLAACGYDAEWDCFPASAFGAPHRRDRLFIVAYAEHATTSGEREGRPRDGQGQLAGDRRTSGTMADPDSGRFKERRECDGESQAGQQAPSGRDAGRCGPPTLADADLARLEGRHGNKLRERAGERAAREGGAFPHALREGRNGARSVLAGAADRAGAFGQPARSDWWDVEPDVGRVANGVPSRVDRLRCLGNAVVPQVAEWIGRQILAHAEEAVIPSKQLPLCGPGKESA